MSFFIIQSFWVFLWSRRRWCRSRGFLLLRIVLERLPSDLNAHEHSVWSCAIINDEFPTLINERCLIYRTPLGNTQESFSLKTNWICYVGLIHVCALERHYFLVFVFTHCLWLVFVLTLSLSLFLSFLLHFCFKHAQQRKMYRFIIHRHAARGQNWIHWSRWWWRR